MDLDALARKYGGTPETKPQDLEALARQFGGQLNEGIPASRVTVAEAIPFISDETRQAISQIFREARAGAAQAAMTPLQLAGASKLGLLPERGAATEAYLRQEFGADPESIAGMAGRFGTEMAMGAPIIRGAGALIEKGAPALGQAVKTGGFEIPATVEGARGIGLRMAGGGIGGLAGTLPFSPEDAVFAGPLGAVLVPVARAALGGGRTLKDLIVSSPQQLAENALLEAGGADLQNALIRTQGMKTTPGYTPSVVERAVEGGVDNLELAALQNRIRLAPKAAQIQADSTSKNMGYLQSQLSRIEGQLAQDITQLSPGDATRLSEVRNNLQRQLAAEEFEAANTGRLRPAGAGPRDATERVQSHRQPRRSRRKPSAHVFRAWRQRYPRALQRQHQAPQRALRSRRWFLQRQNHPRRRPQGRPVVLRVPGVGRFRPRLEVASIGNRSLPSHDSINIRIYDEHPAVQ
jgi:hypothetical protein